MNDQIFFTYASSDLSSGEKVSFKALYGGFHGWYWENQSTNPITIKLQTRGDYIALVPK